VADAERGQTTTVTVTTQATRANSSGAQHTHTRSSQKSRPSTSTHSSSTPQRSAPLVIPGTTQSTTGARPTTSTASSSSTKTCYPATHIASVRIPGTHIAGQTIPGTTINGQTLPTVQLAPVDLPPVTLPATTIPGGCFSVPAAFAIGNTSVRISNYNAIDPNYSSTLTQRYWSADPQGTSTPDPNAPGFGQFNGAGLPKDQYVRPYIRSDGTAVSGYWRNSPSDGLPTCQIISC
jgi:hypothetical protein